MSCCWMGSMGLMAQRQRLMKALQHMDRQRSMVLHSCLLRRRSLAHLPFSLVAAVLALSFILWLRQCVSDRSVGGWPKCLGALVECQSVELEYGSCGYR